MVNNKIRALMRLKNRGIGEVAAYFNISRQAMSNKLSRGSFSAEDLIKFADFLGCELSFNDGKQKITLDLSDIQDGEQTAQD